MEPGTSSATNEFGTNPEGLGRELNIKIADYLESGNYLSLLGIIQNQPDKDKACEVILNSAVRFHQKDHADSVESLVRTALHEQNIDVMGDALKALIKYSYKNNLKGGKFFKHPDKDEFLHLDADGEIVSCKGELATIQEGVEGEGRNYVRSLNSYTVLSGPNKGETFNASERPIPAIA